MAKGDLGRIYDKVRWHFPEGKDCPSLQAAKHHINFAMAFLQSHGLLSEDGEDLFADGTVDDDFALTSEVVNAAGDALLSACYDDWLKEVSYEGPLSSELFEKTFRQLRRHRGEQSMAERPVGGKKGKTAKKQAAPPCSGEPILYDRVSFHWPMAKDRGCKSLEDAKIHLRVVARWLAEHDLLTEEARAIVQRDDIPDDFALTSDMLTDRGNALMMKAYDRWLRNVGYGGKVPGTAVLDKALGELSKQ